MPCTTPGRRAQAHAAESRSQSGRVGEGEAASLGSLLCVSEHLLILILSLSLSHPSLLVKVSRIPFPSQPTSCDPSKDLVGDRGWRKSVYHRKCRSNEKHGLQGNETCCSNTAGSASGSESAPLQHGRQPRHTSTFSGTVGSTSHSMHAPWRRQAQVLGGSEDRGDEHGSGGAGG